MPIGSPSDYSTSASYDLTIAQIGKGPVDALEQRLAEVNNSLSGSHSAIQNASRTVSAQLAPTLREAFKHEEAARVSIERVLDVFNTNLPKLRYIVGQLNAPRAQRDGFKDGKTLYAEGKELHRSMFAASDSLIINKVISNKHAEEALAHAERLAQELENRLG